MDQENKPKGMKGATILALLMFVALPMGIFASCSSSNVKTSAPTSSQSQSTNTVLTIEAVANKTNSVVGKLNQTYRLDTKYKNADGSFMIINYSSITAQKEITRSGNKYNNVVVITCVPPLNTTKEMVANAGAFNLYDQMGKSAGGAFDIYTGSTSDGGSEIVLHSEKDDLTKYKYLSFSPVDNTRYEKSTLLFNIQ